MRLTRVELKRRLLHVRRIKNGSPSTHALGKQERRWLRKLRRLYPTAKYVFVSELKGPLTPAAVQKIVGRVARMPFRVHPLYGAVAGKISRILEGLTADANLSKRFEAFLIDKIQ